MKKRYIIILLLVILASYLIFVSVKVIGEQRKSEELEAVKIFEENVAFRVNVENSIDNINDIQKKLESMQYVKNVEAVSKEEILEDANNKFDLDFMDEDYNIFPNSFIITLEVNNIEDFEKVKTLEDDIRKIDGIDEVNSSCKEFIEVYEKTGIKGMREYDKIMTIMVEQGVDGINAYLDEHKETRKLLKDFIHF